MHSYGPLAYPTDTYTGFDDPRDVDHLTNKPSFSQHLDSEQTGWLQELIWLYLAYEVQRFHVRLRWPHRYISMWDDPHHDPPKERKVPAVMFGVFYPGWMVTTTRHAGNWIDIITQHLSRPFSKLSNTGLDQLDMYRGVIGPWTLTLDLSMILETRHRRSGGSMGQQMNHRDGFYSPPPELRVFEFMMRKYFDVGFRTGMFNPLPGQPPMPSSLDQVINYKIYGAGNLGHIRSFREDALKNEDEFGFMEFSLERYKEPTLSSDFIGLRIGGF